MALTSVPHHTIRFLLIGLGLCLIAAASPLRVVTSVAPITDITQVIGGTAIQLHGLVPAGVNSHTFQPTPRDVRYLAEADLIILNGLYLEVPTEKLVRSSGNSTVTLLKLGDQTIGEVDWIYDFSFPKEHGYPNPHLWLNVAHAMTYAQLIRDRLRDLDAAHKPLYDANTERYLHQLRQLDHCISTGIQTIPAAHRKLLTYHDSWPYFARRYGLQVRGVVQPMPFSEPSARQMGLLIRQIQHAGIPAIFGSAVFPSKIAAKIAAETNVRYISTLRDDNLPGEPGEPQHSYVGMMQANVRTMVHALGGDPDSFLACTATLLEKKE